MASSDWTADWSCMFTVANRVLLFEERINILLLKVKCPIDDSLELSYYVPLFIFHTGDIGSCGCSEAVGSRHDTTSWKACSPAASTLNP